jgi:hypothetical protein
MSKNRFRKGIHLLFQGRECIVEERLPNGDLKLRDIAVNSFRAVAELFLIDAWFEGQLEFLGDTSTTVAQRKASKEFIVPAR